MKKVLCAVLMFCMLLPLCPVMAESTPSPSPFVSGDVVGLFGDSMTQGAQYERFLMMYYATHYPDVDFEIVNFGHAGDNSADLLNKIDRDLQYCPNMTKAYIMIGANDVFKLDGLEDRLEQIVTKVSSQKSVKEVVLIAQCRFYGGGEREGQSILAAQATRNVAKKFALPLVEVDMPMNALMEDLQEDDPTATIFPDGLHPDTTGHLLIANEIIKAQGLTPNGKDLPIITVDASTNTVTEAKNAATSEVSRTGNTWTFTYSAGRLPFPLMKGYELGVQYSDFDTTLSVHDLLQFNGLPSGTYTLSIDGEEVGTYSHVELMRGIDVAAIDGSAVQDRAKLVRRKIEMLHTKTNNYMVLGHIGEYAVLGIEKYNPTLEEVTAAADQKLAAGEIDQNYHDSYINNKKNRESNRAEIEKLREEVKALAENRDFVVTLAQKTSTGVAAKSFSDTENHWGKSYILPLAEQGIINGKGDGLFDPDGSITRAEFMTLVLKVGDITAVSGTSYADVAADAWFADTVATAKTAGLIPDAMVADGKFYPDKNITREEMTAVLTALYESQKPAAKEADVTQFTDKDSFSDWAVGAIAKAFGLGLVAGNPDGSFNAGGNASRAEAAVIMSRLQKLL